MKLKQNALKKLKKTGGFTLIEMLIVVAIIAILVAVSIPMVTKSLDKAKDATDTANERSAKSAAVIEYMTSTEDFTSDKKYYYDAAKGELVKGDAAPTEMQGYGQCAKHKGDYLKVTINNKGEVTLEWSKSKDQGLHSDGTLKK